MESYDNHMKIFCLLAIKISTLLNVENNGIFLMCRNSPIFWFYDLCLIHSFYADFVNVEALKFII